MNVHVKTSARDDIQNVFNSYSSYAVCDKIIFNFNTNGNEARHSVIHRFCGDKRVMYFRGLVSRAQLHSVLRYDKGVDNMLLAVLGECGLTALTPDVLQSFKVPRQHRAQVAATQARPAQRQKRKHDALLARSLCVRELKKEGGPAHSAGLATFDNGGFAEQLLNTRKEKGVRRCTKCQRQGHTKSKCSSLTNLPVQSKTILPGLSVAVPLNSLRDPVLVVFDIETTSGSVYSLEVVQVAASAIQWPCMATASIPHPDFNMFARYNGSVAPAVRRKLTGMDWDSLQGKPTFEVVLERFFLYLARLNAEYGDIVLVAHNGKPFDFPAMFNAASVVNVNFFERLESCHVVGLCDTLMLLRSTKEQKVGLTALIEETKSYCPLIKPLVQHDAADDVSALVHVIQNNTRKSFRLLRKKDSLDGVFIPLDVMRQYSQAMKDEHVHAERQLAEARAEEALPGWVPVPPLIRPGKGPKKLQKSSTKAPTKPPTNASIVSNDIDGFERIGYDNDDDDELSTSRTSRTCSQTTHESARMKSLPRRVRSKSAYTDRSESEDEAFSDVDVSVEGNALADPITPKSITAPDVVTASNRVKSRTVKPVNDDAIIVSDDDANFTTATLVPSLTKPQALLARQLTLSAKVPTIATFMQGDGFMSSNLNSSYDRLQDHLRDVISSGSTVMVTECAKNVPVSASQILCLLERTPGETNRRNYLNMDVIMNYCAILASRNPLCSITSTWVIVWALDPKTSMEFKCSKLTSIDFDNDNIYFPIHHGKIAHWSLIRLKWTGEVWEVYYVDSLFAQDAGDIFCDAVTDMVKAYLTTYRKRMAEAAHARGRKRVKFSRDHGLNAKRASAAFVRVPMPSVKQKDLFNCGCFMLHNIECAIINQPDWTSFPSSTEYFAAYRRRMLLTLMTFDGE